MTAQRTGVGDGWMHRWTDGWMDGENVHLFAVKQHYLLDKQVDEKETTIFVGNLQPPPHTVGAN